MSQEQESFAQQLDNAATGALMESAPKKKHDLKALIENALGGPEPDPNAPPVADTPPPGYRKLFHGYVPIEKPRETEPDPFCQWASAMARVGGAIKNPGKNRDVTVTMKSGGAYSYSYTTLDEILDAVRQPMADNGLSVRWAPRVEAGNGKWTLDSYMSHSGGHTERITMPIIGQPGDMQNLGSFLSYCRRYTMGMWFPIASDEDDDGSKASGKDAQITPRRPASDPRERPTPQKFPPPPTPTPKQEAPPVTTTPTPAGRVPATMDDPAMLPYKQKLMACAKKMHLVEKKARVVDGQNIEVTIIVVNDAIRPIIDKVGPSMFSDGGKNYVVPRDMEPGQLIQLADSLAGYLRELES